MKVSLFRRIGGFFRAVFGVLTHNIGLKLIALALALLVYYSLKQETDSKRNDNRSFFQQTP